MGLQCILPPHMLREIILRGSEVQRQWAIRTLRFSDQLRLQRDRLVGLTGRAIPHGDSGRQRQIFNANNGATLPGSLARGENDPPSSDPAVNEAYDGAGASYDFFSQVFGRNSLDGSGMPIQASVHYEKGYDNAFWNGGELVFGDGDEDLPVEERLFNRFTVAIDVIGHELSHGITQYEAALNYRDQAGALNESFSDVFGILVKQHHLGQAVDQADWIVGEGLFTQRVHGQGIRSLKAPGTAYDDPVLGKDPQPANMKDYQVVLYDNGGVHINSGIPNHAFYLTSVHLGGYAWEKAGWIWYVALRDKLTASADFQVTAYATHQVAAQLYGKGSLEQQAVAQGWSEVGISVETAAETPGCLPALSSLLRMIPVPTNSIS